MELFEQTLGVVAPIVGAIMVLTVFFKVVGWLSSRSTARPTRIAFKGVLDARTRATVHLSTGTTYENVRILGFLDSGSEKGVFPFELHGMVILEPPDGRRILVPAKLIRMIEVPPRAA
jgi:hypothetical protein